MFAQLRTLLPKLASAETRSFIVQASPGLPAGEFGLIESFCDDFGCDCRRVIFSVLRRDPPAVVAVINFGWETPGFYASRHEWADVEVMMMAAATLEPLEEQSLYAEPLLVIVRDQILADLDYVDRIVRHYRVFKARIDASKRERGLATPRIRKR
jgi:hypothetical protein